jgi:serine/threonine-protein kinase
MSDEVPFRIRGNSGESKPGGMPLPVRQIEGFELLDEISRSDLWILYKAREIERNLMVFLKLYPVRATQKIENRRFLREARVHALLNSPYIQLVFDARETSEGAFLVLEYIDGPALEARLDGPKLSWEEAAWVFRGLAEGMRMAHHQYVVHCNLRLANIFLSHSGQPKITGFQYAILRHPANHSEIENLQLPRDPISPEQINGSSSLIGPPTDVYALGVILYQLMNWTNTFPVDEIRAQTAAWQGQPEKIGLLPGCPPALEAICCKCLQQNPGDRYPDASALVEDLEKRLGPM